MVRILIVDDDAGVRDVVRYELETQGWEVAEADSAAALAEALKRQAPDLILLDIRLPDQDGLSIAQRLRATSAIPIIMLTGLGGDIDRIVGLEMGADDYVVKPFNPRELVARIKAVLRRAGTAMQPSAAADAMGHDCRRFAGWMIDLSARVLETPGGEQVALTNAEFLLLEAFVKAPRQVLSRDQLLEKTRSHDAEVFDRTIDVLILRLRRKIEPNPRAPQIIRTERGAGYVLDADVKRL
ncbi:response regulator [Tropicimonas sp. IMCC34043]|uniref:response regulator n=1 Tax=Tropicimonas sp. IMCC34043 TaxID=2248760 RepID=UPI000E23745A|nr:response regulator [Tropicimonas sp. IMCC34043]